MKATLEYNLPEESVEHDDAIHGTDWKLVVWNLDNYIRNAIKHGHNLKDANHALDEVRSKLYEELEDRNLILP